MGRTTCRRLRRLGVPPSCRGSGFTGTNMLTGSPNGERPPATWPRTTDKKRARTSADGAARPPLTPRTAQAPPHRLSGRMRSTPRNTNERPLSVQASANARLVSSVPRLSSAHPEINIQRKRPGVRIEASSLQAISFCPDRFLQPGGLARGGVASAHRGKTRQLHQNARFHGEIKTNKAAVGQSSHPNDSPHPPLPSAR